MKYYSPQTDYSALERELAGSKGPQSSRSSNRDDRDEFTEYEDQYSEDYPEER